jgi:putative MFS transporter
MKCFYIMKKSNSITPTYSSTLSAPYYKQTLNLWVLWFVVSYIFFGFLYLIPELVGKDKNNVNFADLIRAVVFSTCFEIVGILTTLIIEINKVGRLGGIRLSFTLCLILSLLCSLRLSHWQMFLHISKGAIQISSRALYIYTSECYPTEIRGIALGLSNVFTRLAGILTPICNEILLTVSPTAAFIGIFISSLVGCYISYSITNETLGKKIE